jgi:prepilin-type N-terminal cleavage/methylation domain-containing protein
MKRQQGFTLVELVTVLLIIGIIVNAWLPSFISMKKKAQAARIVGDFLVIRDAATMYYSNHGRWPRNAGLGSIPKGMGHYLPDGFLWDLRPGMDVRYTWENLGFGLGQGSPSDEVVGVSVYSEDNALLKAIRVVYGGRMVFARGFEGTGRVILFVQSAGKQGRSLAGGQENADPD